VFVFHDIARIAALCEVGALTFSRRWTRHGGALNCQEAALGELGARDGLNNKFTLTLIR
jgi:hypothetical protein